MGRCFFTKTTIFYMFCLEVVEHAPRRAGIKFGARQSGGGGYAAADAIRDELFERHGVAIDNRASTWSHAGSGPCGGCGGRERRRGSRFIDCRIDS